MAPAKISRAQSPGNQRFGLCLVFLQIQLPKWRKNRPKTPKQADLYDFEVLIFPVCQLLTFRTNQFVCE